MNLLTWRAPADAWRGLMTGFLLLAAAAVFKALRAIGGLDDSRILHVATSLLVGGAWLLSARFVLLDVRGRRFWAPSLLGMLALVLFAGAVGRTLAIMWSVFFLSGRRYRCWRHISDRKRAVAFGLGAVALVLAAVCWGFWKPANGEGLAPVRGLGAWSLVSLILFWAWSMFHLAMGMRLHFLRLRPKLAVSAVLIGVVPLLLVVGLGLMILYTGLGGATAARAGAMLESWRMLASQGVDLAPALFDTTFTWPDETGSAPAWAPELAAAFQRSLANEVAGIREADEDEDEDEDENGDASGDSAAAITEVEAAAEAASAPIQISVPAAAAVSLASIPADSTGWFLADRRLWLIRWQGLDTEQPRAQAWQLSRKPLTELSRTLRVGLSLSSTSGRNSDGNFVVGFQDGASGKASGEGEPAKRRRFEGIEASYRDAATTGGWFPEALFFGGTFLNAGELRGDRLKDYSVFMRLRVGAADLKADFIQGESNLNVAIVVALAVVAFLFLIIEGFALFFGVRISEGIVAGVHALHRGTRAVAGGDLDAVITIPNEDEFGDLARSFNEMTLAVKHGREIALANDRLTQELSTARAIQIRLLPGQQPLVPGYEVTGASIPSREIGGDYYDFLAQGEDAIGIAIGDVSGKGMPAALLMSNLQASLHGQVLHRGTVASVVQRVNDLLVRSTDPHMFATFFYGVLETATGSFTCTNAGHNPPLVLRRDGSLERLTMGGLLLGMIGDMVYLQDTVVLAPGEVIVMYTDGITEAVSPGADEEDPEAMFGEERLCDVLRRSRHLPASGIQDAILAAVADHTRGVAQSDDITLVVIRRQD
ncbi:MAG: SpoIIE family protein phosphatase [bacterium]|nr:SpoIIE family protein phosphatase [bacterium]